MDVFHIDSVDIDSIECIRDPCIVSTVSTYMSHFAYVWKMQYPKIRNISGSIELFAL